MNKDIIFRKVKSWKFLIFLILCSGFYIFCQISKAPPMGKMSAAAQADLGMHEIAPGEELSQSFVWEQEKLAGISLMLERREGDMQGMAEISLYRGDAILDTWEVDKFSIGNTWTKLLLEEPLQDAQGTYTIIVSAEEETGLTIGLTSNQAGSASVWMNSGTGHEGQYLCWRGVERNMPNAVVMISAAAVLIFILAGVVLLAKRKAKQEWLFLFIYAVIGIYCLAAVPESRTPDEFSHFARSYEIAHGRLISEMNEETDSIMMKAGGTLPGNMRAQEKLFRGRTTVYDILDSVDERLDKENPQFYGYANTALYAPTSYLFQAFGIRIASWLTDRVIVLLYAGRFMNWAAIGFLLFWSIRKIPVGKTALAFTALLPMNIQQFNSLSADGFAFAMTAVFLSCVLSFRAQEGVLRKRQTALLYVITVLICLCKVVYAPVCLLLFLIPWRRFGSKRRYAVHVVGLGAVSIAAALGWFMTASSFLVEIQPGVNSAAQISFILTHPLQYARTLFNTWSDSFFSYFLEAAGQKLGALDIPLGEFLPLSALAVLVLTGGYADDGEAPDTLIRYLMLAVAALVILLTFTSLYIQWTPYRCDTVRGVQGRYFLPVIPLLILGMGKLRKCISTQTGYLGMAAVNVCAFSAMLVYMV